MKSVLGNSSLTIFENNVQEYYPDLVRDAMEKKQQQKISIREIKL